MRYQRLSPDCPPLSNGKKPNLRTCKEEDSDNGRISNCNGFEGKPLRYRPGSTPSTSEDHFSQFHVPDLFQPKQENGSGVDILLQWGHKKRSRVSRAECRSATDDSSAQAKQIVKIQRRVVVSGVEKQATTTSMSPPCATRSVNQRPSIHVQSTGSLLNRSLEGRPVTESGPQSSNGNGRIHSRSAEKRSPSSDKMDRKGSGSLHAFDEDKPKRSTVQAETIVEPVPQSEPEVPEKMNLDLFEWPRIFIALSRKEKEDDFLAIKGTKLPQRPKKRAKNVDKTLQYCFPGMWLSDLTRSRYEVREKKCVKKRRRGLKGMESSDSE